MTLQLNLGRLLLLIRSYHRQSTTYIYIVLIVTCIYLVCFCNAYYRGILGGEENGRRGYLLTFVIAYARVNVTVYLRMCVNICVYTYVQVCM